MIKKILALCLSVILSLAFVGCSASKVENVYNIEGEDIWSGLYLSYSIDVINEAISRINKAEKEAGRKEIDSKKWTEYKVDGTDALTWARDKTLQGCKSYVAINNKFKEYDLKISEETKKSSKEFDDYAWKFLGGSYMKNGVSFETFQKVTVSRDKRQEVFLKYYGEGGVEPVSQDEIKAKLLENYYKLKRTSFEIKNTDGSSMNDEQKANLKAILEGYVESIKNGASIDDIKKQYDDYLKAQKEANKTEKQDTSNENNEFQLQEQDKSNTEQKEIQFEVVKKDGLSDAFKEAIGKTSFEQPVLIEDNGNFVIAIPYDLSNDTENIKKYSNEIISELKKDDFNNKLVEWTKDYVVKTNDRLYNKYNPKNIDLSI